MCWYQVTNFKGSWISHIKNTSLKIEPLTFDVDLLGDITRKLILNHLMIFEDQIAQYFPNISADKYLYDTLSESPNELSLEQKE